MLLFYQIVMSTSSSTSNSTNIFALCLQSDMDSSIDMSNNRRFVHILLIVLVLIREGRENISYQGSGNLQPFSCWKYKIV